MMALELILEAIFGAFVVFLFGRLSSKIDKSEKKQEEREMARREYEFHQVQMNVANAKLGRANAIALQNGKCNGETHSALEFLNKVAEDQNDFLIRHGVDNIF